MEREGTLVALEGDPEKLRQWRLHWYGSDGKRRECFHRHQSCTYLKDRGIHE